MDNLIRQDYTVDPLAMKSEFDTAEPFRHLVMDNFFDAEFAEALLQDFPPFDNSKAMNENGEIGRKCVHEQLGELTEPYVQLDKLIQTRAFLDWLGQVTGIEDLQYDPHYFGGGTHENCHGQGLDAHVDFNKHPITGLHRRLNLIVYLNHEWGSDWGGAIEFHEDPRLPPEQNAIKTVLPAFNRAVLFETTHWSWHGFERINLPDGDDSEISRKSVALYFYSKTRPEKEQTKPHSTIYVERPLPSHIRPGQQLSESDFQHIQGLLSSRDQHLQRLYRNISDLSANVEDLIEQRDRAVAMIRSTEEQKAFPDAVQQNGLFNKIRRWLSRTHDS